MERDWIEHKTGIDEQRQTEDPMKLWMLGSGSSGNAVLCECEDQRILIDCGFVSE